MALTLHSIAPAKGSRTKKFKIGRGYATGRGTTAGRGTKGQRARTGGRKRLKLKGLKQMLLAFPKNRGFISRFPTMHDVPMKRVMAAFAAGDRVDIDALKAKKLVPKTATYAKVIGGVAADKKLTFIDIAATASVKDSVAKAGGSFEKSKPKKNAKSKSKSKSKPRA